MRNQLFKLLASNAKRAPSVAAAANNTIYIYDVIVGSQFEAEFFGGVSPEMVIEALASMSGPVTVRINSPGGDVFGARVIAQHMREYSGELSVIVDGVAASAASLLAISGASLAMAPGSMLMIHRAWTLALGNTDDMLATAELLEKIDQSLAESYAAKAGGNPEKYADLMRAETWFTADEAVAIGLADTALSQRPDAKAKAWDLSAYQRPPAQAVDAPAIDAAADENRRRQQLARLRLKAA